MKWGVHQRVRISSLTLPGDMKARGRAQHVIDLAADIRELGDEPINCPTFWAVDKTIVAGRDRMAALLLNGAKHCWVRWVVEATDDERKNLEVSENLHRRRDDRDELVASRVRKVAETIASEHRVSGTKIPEAVTRQPTRGDVVKARAKVAAQLGIKPASVKQAEKRAAKKAAPAPADDIKAVRSQGGIGGQILRCEPTKETSPDPDMIAMHGLAAPAAWLVEVANTVVALGEADKHLRLAQTALSRVKAANYPGAVWQRLKAHIHAAAHDVRSATPAAVCLYCRDPGGAGGRRGNCNGCNKHGFLLAEQMPQVPREMLAAGAKPVTPLCRSAAKGMLRIEDDAGNPIEVAKFDPESADLPFGDEPAEDTA